MKKLSLIIIIVLIGLSGFSQGLLNKVTSDIFTIKDKSLLTNKVLALPNGTFVLPGVFKWRIDATLAFTENIYHKDTKEWLSTPFSAVGPAISLQHFVPTSVTDLTPYNNWGVGLGLAAGVNILQPDFSYVKVILEGNILQYLRGGFTATFNTKNWFGYFIGTGITF